MNNEADDNHDGWIQDPDGNWHPKPESKAIGQLGQVVLAIVIVLGGLIGAAWLWNNNQADAKDSRCEYIGGADC